MGDFILDVLHAIATTLYSPFVLDFWEYLLFGVRGLVIYASLHGAYLTWKYGPGGTTRALTSIAMLLLGVKYILALLVQLPWYQIVSMSTPSALIRDTALLFVLVFHLKNHQPFGRRFWKR